MADLISRHGKKAADSLKYCKDRVERARKFVEGEGIALVRSAMIDLYRGHQRPDTVPSDQDYAIVNIAKATIDTILPSISINNPTLAVDPRNDASVEAAAVAEAAGNYYFERYRYRDQLQLALLDSLVGGLGVVKVGWKMVEDEVSRYAEDVEDEYAAALNAADETAEGPIGEGEDEAIAAQIPMTERRVVADHPIVERVSPFDVFLDPDASNLTEIRWVAQRIYRPLHEVQNDPRYDRKARSEVKAWAVESAIDNDIYRGSRGNAWSDLDSELCVVWELWDLREGTWCCFADDGDRFLIRPRTSPYGFDSPFELLPHTIIPEVLYPMGELESIEALQHELNRLRTDLMNHRAKFARKYVIKPDAFDEKGIADLQSNVDGLVIPIEGSEDVNRVFAPLPVTQASPELYNGREQIIDDILMVSGRNEYQMNTEAQRRRTATESSIINDAARTRGEYRLQRYEEFVSRVATKVIVLVKAFLTSEEVAKIDIDGVPSWITFTADDLQGEYVFSVKSGSTAPMSPAMRRREAMELSQAIAPFVQMGVVNPAEVAKLILRTFGESNADKFIMAPAPMGMPGMPPDMGGGGPPPEMTPMDAASQGISPEVAQQNQLAGQVGLQLPSPDMQI